MALTSAQLVLTIFIIANIADLKSIGEFYVRENEKSNYEYNNAIQAGRILSGGLHSTYLGSGSGGPSVAASPSKQPKRRSKSKQRSKRKNGSNK